MVCQGSGEVSYYLSQLVHGNPSVNVLPLLSLLL